MSQEDSVFEYDDLNLRSAERRLEEVSEKLCEEPTEDPCRTAVKEVLSCAGVDGTLDDADLMRELGRFLERIYEDGAAHGRKQAIDLMGSVYFEPGKKSIPASPTVDDLELAVRLHGDRARQVLEIEDLRAIFERDGMELDEKRLNETLGVDQFLNEATNAFWEGFDDYPDEINNRLSDAVHFIFSAHGMTLEDFGKPEKAAPRLLALERAEDDPYGWADDVRHALGGLDDKYVGDFEDPPCLGGVVSLGDGDYVSEARFMEVLPDGSSRAAFTAIRNTDDMDELTHICELIRRRDADGLEEEASRLASGDDAAVFYTEIYPEDVDRKTVGKAR